MKSELKFYKRITTVWFIIISALIIMCIFLKVDLVLIKGEEEIKDEVSLLFYILISLLAFPFNLIIIFFIGIIIFTSIKLKKKLNEEIYKDQVERGNI
jgi:uncharacterized membrane protein